MSQYWAFVCRCVLYVQDSKWRLDASEYLAVTRSPILSLHVDIITTTTTPANTAPAAATAATTTTTTTTTTTKTNETRVLFFRIS
jgi:hypothetical protein